MQTIGADTGSPTKPKSTITYAKARTGLMSSPATSYWLKAAIESLERRDPLDAASDAGFLFGLMEKRAEEALGKGAA